MLSELNYEQALRLHLLEKLMEEHPVSVEGELLARVNRLSGFVLTGRLEPRDCTDGKDGASIPASSAQSPCPVARDSQLTS